MVASYFRWLIGMQKNFLTTESKLKRDQVTILTERPREFLCCNIPQWETEKTDIKQRQPGNDLSV